LTIEKSLGLMHLL